MIEIFPAEIRKVKMYYPHRFVVCSRSFSKNTYIFGLNRTIIHLLRSYFDGFFWGEDTTVIRPCRLASLADGENRMREFLKIGASEA